jgi:transposase-like protein
MALFSGGALGTLVRLRCPSCGTVQARAKKPGGGKVKYRCHSCHRSFTREDGEAAAKRKGSSR